MTLDAIFFLISDTDKKPDTAALYERLNTPVHFQAEDQITRLEHSVL